MKSKDISDNMERFEKKKQYQTEQKLKEKKIKNIKISKNILNNINNIGNNNNTNNNNNNIHNNFIFSPKTKKYSRNSNGNSLSQINSYSLFRSLTNELKSKTKQINNLKSYYNNNNNYCCYNYNNNKNNFFSLRRTINKTKNIKNIISN